MFQPLLRTLAIIWGSLIIIISLCLYIVSILPSSGTILITNDLLLDNDERFHLYDIARQKSYAFTPDITDEALFVSLAPTGRRMAVLNVNLNRFFLTIVNFRGQTLVDEISVNNVLHFDEVQWSSDGQYFMYFDTNQAGISLFILKIATGDLSEIPIGDMRHPSAVWTNNRTDLAFTYNDEAEAISQIWIADANGDKPLALTHNENDSYCPVWSPDGETIAYLEELSRGERLRYINVETREESGYFSDIWFMTTCPLWSNDGKSIIFIALDATTRQTTVIQLDIKSGQQQEILKVNQTVSLHRWR